MKEFEYQKEFRIVLYNNEMAPKIIRIGSLKEYAAIFPVDALDTLEVKWNPNNIKYNE
jgi:hypothetical protein